MTQIHAIIIAYLRLKIMQVIQGDVCYDRIEERMAGCSSINIAICKICTIFDESPYYVNTLPTGNSNM
jgi:hypothetical protein